MDSRPFWQQKTLEQMTPEEWESLCDGCGKCCLLKLEDEDSGELYFTDVCCELFNPETCRCSDYINRKKRVPDCLILTPDNVGGMNSLPSSCAYRLLANGQPLPEWHPLVSTDQLSTHNSGNSVQGRVLSAQYVHPDELEERIVQWVN